MAKPVLQAVKNICNNNKSSSLSIRMVHHRDETAVSNPNFVCFIVFQRISFDFCAQKYFQRLNIFE